MQSQQELVLSIVEHARHLISEEQSWLGTDGFFGYRSDAGELHELSMYEVYMGTSARPTCFCAVGAAMYASGAVFEDARAYLTSHRPEFFTDPKVRAFFQVLEIAQEIAPTLLSEEEVQKLRIDATWDEPDPEWTLNPTLQDVNDVLGHTAVLRVLDATIQAIKGEQYALA